MNLFFSQLNSIMQQDIGGRGLLSTLPCPDLHHFYTSLDHAKRIILLTGFPVNCGESIGVRGETDGPSGSANLAYALLESGCDVHVVTDRASYPLLKAALLNRAPKSDLILLPEENTDTFARELIGRIQPTHIFALERPGLADDGHYHNMRGEIIDHMVSDSQPFMTIAKQQHIPVVAIGDGGNEFGMGSFKKEILSHVPSGDIICTRDSADYPLASGVSNWWGWGIAAILSLKKQKNLLPTPEEETTLLKNILAAGAVDGCTKASAMTVDAIPLDKHLDILTSVRKLTQAAI